MGLFCVPQTLRKLIIKIHHDDAVSGHAGIYRTYTRVVEKYYWPKMSRDIEQYVKSCIECQRKKAPRPGRFGMLEPLTIHHPFYRVGIDFLGPLPTSHGKRYIVVAIDYFTKWIETRATSTCSAQATAKFMIEQIFCRHGAPSILVSDQGRNFTSGLIKEINRILNTTHNFTTSYHPQTNGQVEHVNGTLATMLAKYVNCFDHDDRVSPLVYKVQELAI